MTRPHDPHTRSFDTRGPRIIHSTLVVLAMALAACGGGEGGKPPTIDCSTVTVPSYAAVELWPLCTSCHSSTSTGTDREMAPVGVNFDTYAAAKAQAASAAAQVNAGIMPPMTALQPSAAQKAQLYAWALCGTPE